ncbi:MAG TPA: hypothetical protein VH703_01975 [Solirubrobacterales bacterium]|jgi:hypothetical protein
MQAQSSCVTRSNEAQDLHDQGIVLSHVLALHPEHLTIPDLVRELTAGATEYAESDAFERAVRDLTGVGLLACPGGVVTPTRAALHCDRLGVL